MWCRALENSSWEHHWLYFFLQVALSYFESTCKLFQRCRDKQAMNTSVWVCCTFPFLEDFLCEWQTNPQKVVCCESLHPSIHPSIPLPFSQNLCVLFLFLSVKQLTYSLKVTAHMDIEPMKIKAHKYTIISLPEESLQMPFSIAARWLCSRRLHQSGYPLLYSAVLKMQKVKCFFLNQFFLKGPPAMQIIKANT